MTRDTFMPENGPRVLYCGADVKVFALRIVSRDEIKTARVFVIDAGRVHETTRTGGLEGFWKLPDIKRADVIRNRDQPIRFQEVDHFLLTTFIRLQERLLILGVVVSLRGLRTSRGGIGNQSPQGAIPSQFRLAQHFYVVRF